MHAYTSLAITAAIATGIAFTQAAADTLTVRCTGYEKEVIMLSSGKSVGWSKVNEPFDVTIDTTKGIGWFPGATMRVYAERPAKLDVDPDTYTLTATPDVQTGKVIVEWVVLDRIKASMKHYAQAQGSTTQEIRRGGTCERLVPKF